MTPPSSLIHVLQTRFNMPTPGREASFRNQPGWLGIRFDLFEKYCLPSVAAQTAEVGEDFIWIIYFDEETPKEFRERVEILREQVPFLPHYTGMFPASGWPRSLRHELGKLPPFVLTSRLDNDDALAVDYMERTSSAAGEAIARGPVPDGTTCRRVGIVVTKGYIRSSVGAYEVSHSCNAFTSWLERSDEDSMLKTALGISHMAAAEEGPLVQVPGSGGWLQIIHGGNVSNKVRGRRVSPEELTGRFLSGALEGLRPVSGADLLWENGIARPLRGTRDFFSAGVQRWRRHR